PHHHASGDHAARPSCPSRYRDCTGRHQYGKDVERVVALAPRQEIEHFDSGRRDGERPKRTPFVPPQAAKAGDGQRQDEGSECEYLLKNVPGRWIVSSYA